MTAPRAAGATKSVPTRQPPLDWARPAALAVLAGLVMTVVGALVTDAATPLPIGDPGPVVRWGLPLVRVVHDLAAAMTVGLLGMAAFLVPETTRTTRRTDATRLAALAATVWAAAAVVGVVLEFAAESGLHLADPAFVLQLGSLVLDLEATRVQVISILVALVVAVGATVATSRAAMGWLTLAALGGLSVLALTGHAAGSTSHDEAVNALAAHLVGMAIWVGGLLALVAMRPRLGADLGITVSRYSTIAGWGFALVALSGVESAWIRVGTLSALGTPYGQVLLVKVAALLFLGVAGWRHRRMLARRLTVRASDSAAFVRLALGEVVVMGLAVGAAVALSRSAPPVADRLPGTGRVLELTGYPDPGPITAADWFTEWRATWLFLGLSGLMIALYAVGVRRLWLRGDRWPAARTASWVVGWLLFVYATCGPPGIWGRVMFSTHMVMHMVVAMVVPLLLVPAASATLALRALPARPDKTWGPREVLLQVLHSRVLAVLSHPVVAAGLFFASLAAFYYSPAFETALTTHTGHLLMVAHFLLTGYLFTWVLVGVDPGPRRWPPLMLLMVLFATISFHAFFGVALTGSRELLAPGFFTALHLPWLADPLADQHTAGEIAWGVGEAPTLVLALMVTFAWVRADRAEAERTDRQADRDGDAELAAYNAYLARRKAQLEKGERR